MHDEVSETENIRKNLSIERMIIEGCDILLDVNQTFVRQGELYGTHASPLFTFFTSQATALLVVFEVNSLFQHCLDSFESVWICFSLLVFENITECLNLKVEELCKKYLSFIIFDPFTYLELFFILSLCPDITPNPSILTKCSKDEAYAYYPVIVIIQVFWQNMCTKSWYGVIWYFDTAVI